MTNNSDRILSWDLAFFLFFVALTAETRALGAYLVLLLVYLALEMQEQRWPRTAFIGKLALIYFAAIGSLLGMGVLNMTARYDYLFNGADPVESLAGKTHDGMMESEEAVRLFLAGDNPYGADFSETDIKWIPSPVAGEPNPANQHYAYQLGTFVLPAPFKGLIEGVLGYFDMRPFYFVMFVVGMLALPEFGARRIDKLGLAMTLGLNFSFLAFLAEGRNDIMGLAFMLWAWMFLAVRGRVVVAAALMGLACAVKQSTWFMAPFFALYALGEDRSRENIKRTALRLWPLPAVAAAFVLPFFLRDATAYIEDCFLYLSGALPGGYPIFGFSLARILVEIGVLDSYRASWPALLFHAIFSLPALGLLLRWQWKRNTMRVAWMGYALFLIVYGFFSYFFNNNLVVFAVTCMLIAFWAHPPREAIRESTARALGGPAEPAPAAET